MPRRYAERVVSTPTLITEQPRLTEKGLYYKFSFEKGGKIIQGDVAMGLEDFGAWLIAVETPNDISTRTISPDEESHEILSSVFDQLVAEEE